MNDAEAQVGQFAHGGAEGGHDAVHPELGTLEDLKPWTDTHTTTIDRSFEGKVLVPGFVDPHQHVLPMAIIASLPNVAYYDTAMPYGPAKKGLKTKEAVIERLREYDRNMKNPNDVLVAWGYDAVANGGHLNKAQLDAISTTRPVYVWDASEHNGYLNTAMLQRAKLTEAFKTVAGVGLDAQGDFTGIFIGNPDTADASATNTNFTPSPSVTNSGVMNYLNKFGEITRGDYKTYDPVSELYYATLRYLKHLSNVPSYTDMTGANQATFYPLMASPLRRKELAQMVGDIDFERPEAAEARGDRLAGFRMFSNFPWQRQ